MTVGVAVRPGAQRIALAYADLTKPRIVLLVLMTGLPALLMAKPGWPGAPVFFATLAGVALAAMAGASFNHYLDRDIDALMRRTASRPLPAGVLPPSHALGLGLLLTVASWLVLFTNTNLLAAALAQISIFYYAVVYTAWLKRRTPQNIVIGGGAGAAAPLIAWAAVTGTIEPPAILLFAIVFLWTPPHFWALAYYRNDDYQRANIPMLPLTHGLVSARRHILIYTLVLVPVSLVLAPIGAAGPIYWIPAAAFGGAFIYYAWRLWRSAAIPHAVHLFRFSILYLFALYLFLTLDAVWGMLSLGV